ncbi:MAG: insulinase family protein [Planctomycetes bacterium]|nr:insulinase family protein [Planctomycetota bacterium]
MPPMTLRRTRLPGLKLEVTSGRLLSSCPFTLIRTRGRRQTFALIGTQYGSIDLRFRPGGTGVPPAPGDGWLDTPPGVAHFLEHQMFKKARGPLDAEFARLGAQSNAYTDYASTCYFFACTDHVAESLKLLGELVAVPHFTRESVDREREIIAQELKMYLDLPDVQIVQHALTALYRRHPVRIDIGGTLESIAAITPEVLTQCHGAFYDPSNLRAIVVGDVEAEAAAEALSEGLSRSAGTRRAGAAEEGSGLSARKILRDLPPEPSALDASSREARMDVARPKFLLAIKDARPPGPGERCARRELATELALDLVLGKGAPLYTRLYESALIDDSFGASYTAHPTFGFTFCGGDTDEPERLADALRAGWKKAAREGVKTRDLRRAKRKMLGRWLRMLDGGESTALFCFASQTLGVDPFHWPRRMRRVSRDEVVQRIRDLAREERQAVAVVKG